MNDLFSSLDYPHAAGSKRVGPSEDAAKAVTPTIKEAHRKILFALRADGPATADEIAERIGKTILYTRPRMSEMVNLGLIVETEVTRPNDSGKPATVWAPQSARVG